MDNETDDQKWDRLLSDKPETAEKLADEAEKEIADGKVASLQELLENG
jgi:hypothetical protein